MAESLDANPTTANASSPKIKSQKKGPNPLLEGVSSFLKVTTWLAVGLVFFFLGIICKIKRPVPAAWEPFFTQYIPHLPYFICGLGFLCLGHARGFLKKEYQAEQKKDPLYPHAWKSSLLGTQVFLLYLAGLYAILFGCNKVPAVGMLGLVFFIACFLLYLLIYQIEYFKNRLPALAALRIAIMAFLFAGLSYCLWTMYQMIIPSLILAFLGVYAGIYSLSYSGPVPQKGTWFKYIFMIATVALLGTVGYYVLDFWKPQTVPLNTIVVAKGLRGEISNLVYSPQGNQIVFNQKLDGQWFLRMVGSNSQSPVTVKLPDVDGPFHSVFVDGGKSLLLDAPQAGKRQLVKVDAATGALTVLVKDSLEPFSGGLPWSDSANQFLFVTQDKKGFSLNSWTPDSAKPTVLYSSPSSILSPSWIDEGNVTYVNGVDATPYVLNVESKTVTPIISDEETKVNGELVESDPLVDVLPSPDNFRYLCVSLGKDGKTTLWTMLMDSTKRVELYKTDDQLSDVAWLANGQKIVFERNGLERGFKSSIKGIVVLDANLGTSEALVPSQITSHSPATSPDGIKIAFVGSEGLWYPSLDSGIWVDVLR